MLSLFLGLFGWKSYKTMRILRQELFLERQKQDIKITPERKGSFAKNSLELI
jgi:hypothetical protein